MNEIKEFIQKLEDKGLSIRINPERPIFVQPEDRIIYRAHRILLILKSLNTTLGLSKEVVACVDFLLRNPTYQKEFVLQYFKNQHNIISKLKSISQNSGIDMDKNIVQYKSVPWDLRFNDMFLFLLVRGLVNFIGSEKRARVILSEKGINYSNHLEEIFPMESNFLDVFGKRLAEEKTINLITNVIPNSYWKENEKLFH